MDVSSTRPKVSAALLMPTMYPSVMAALRRSATPTAGSLARAVLATSASGRKGLPTAEATRAPTWRATVCTSMMRPVKRAVRGESAPHDPGRSACRTPRTRRSRNDQGHRLPWHRASAGLPRLPSERDAGVSAGTRAYLAGILPDTREVREAMAGRLGVSSESQFSLLGEMGADFPGAIQFLSDEQWENYGSDDGELVPVDDAQIAARLRGLREGRQDWGEGGEHWSLGGAQKKFALRRLRTRMRRTTRSFSIRPAWRTSPRCMTSPLGSATPMLIDWRWDSVGRRRSGGRQGATFWSSRPESELMAMRCSSRRRPSRS